MNKKIPIYQPRIAGNEKKYVNECLDSSWISSRGKYISLFEEGFANYIGVKHATAVCNGTVALHLALLALDIAAGDEIIVPTFTYIATTNAILYMGAKPIFIDIDPATWQMDVAQIESKISPKTKAILAVHLYGHPCEMDGLCAVSKKHNLYLIEDCAEAIGSTYKGKHVGGFGDIATFSFYGNKTITTGEGGMVVSNTASLIDTAFHLKNQGVSKIAYWHDVIGYNYRMTNIQAAIGLAQLEQIDDILAKKQLLAQTYLKAFEGTALNFHKASKDISHSYWMCSVLIPKANLRDALREYLNERGIETRPLFYPAHLMHMYASFAEGQSFSESESIAARGINLPSYPDLALEDAQYIAQQIIDFVNSNG